jgi:TPR repeat protein
MDIFEPDLDLVPEDTVPNPALENMTYHLLDSKQLFELVREGNDAEALSEYGYRLRFGIGFVTDEKVAWRFIKQAARMGHAISLGRCCYNGEGLQCNYQRAFRLFNESAIRGHPAGEFSAIFSTFFRVSVYSRYHTKQSVYMVQV